MYRIELFVILEGFYLYGNSHLFLSFNYCQINQSGEQYLNHHFLQSYLNYSILSLNWIYVVSLYSIFSEWWMSISNSIITLPFHFTYLNKCYPLWIESEKGDLINQSSLPFILLIINKFDSSVQLPPRIKNSKSIDWNRFRSHSYSQILLNDTIECITIQLNGYERREILQFTWFTPLEWTEFKMDLI